MPERYLKKCVERKKQCFAVIIINKNSGVNMFGKKPSEEMEKEDFLSRFGFINNDDMMNDFRDK